MTKTFLSIGAGPGIGLSTARRFAREGFKIILCARNSERLIEYASLLTSEGAKVETRVVDASSPEAVANLVSTIGSELSVLHYNAAVLHHGPTGDLLMRPIDAETPASLHTDINVNVTSALTAIHAALKPMRAAGSGTILLTGGGVAVDPLPAVLTLSVGKAALRTAAMALFEFTRKDNIHVATVTVSDRIAADSPDARAIGEAFWALHAQPKAAWTFETTYSVKTA